MNAPVATHQALLADSERLLRMLHRDVERLVSLPDQLPDTLYTLGFASAILKNLAFALSAHDDATLRDARRRFIRELVGTDQLPIDHRHGGVCDPSDLGSTLSAALADVRGTKPVALSLIADIATAELQAINRQRSIMAGDAEAAVVVAGNLAAPVTLDVLDAYFSSTSVFSGLRTVSVRQMVGGFSKDTFLITTVDSQGGSRELVLRRDMPFGPTDTSAADEFALLASLLEAGLPVPRPFAASRDSSALGRPFMIVEKIAGENAKDRFAEDAKLARTGSLQLATLLGKLHSLDPRSLGLLEHHPSTPADQVRHYLLKWKSFWERNRQSTAPLAELAFQWLVDNIPLDMPRLVAVHGDVAPHNMLVDGDRVTALLDWEYAHAGDAAEDLEYVRLYVEPYVAWNDFLDSYLRAGGVRTSPDGALYYELFRALRNFLCCDVMWHGFSTDRYPVNKLAMGFVFRTEYLKAMADTLLTITQRQQRHHE